MVFGNLEELDVLPESRFLKFRFDRCSKAFGPCLYKNPIRLKLTANVLHNKPLTNINYASSSSSGSFGSIFAGAYDHYDNYKLNGYQPAGLASHWNYYKANVTLNMEQENIDLIQRYINNELELSPRQNITEVILSWIKFRYKDFRVWGDRFRAHASDDFLALLLLLVSLQCPLILFPFVSHS